MTACHITTVHAPFDDRIFFKQCVSLAAAGFGTTLIAPMDRETNEAGVRILPVKVPAQRLLRPLLGAWRAYRKAKALRSDIYQVHDPELLWVALLLKKPGNRVIYDMHESMREHILTKTWLGPLFFRRFAAWLYGRFERRAVRRCDAVLVVVDHMRDELVRFHGERYAPKFHVVRNLPVLAVIDRTVEPQPRAQEFTFVYAGGLSEVRGIRELALALAQVPNARLKLIGSWSGSGYRETCIALPGWAQVEEVGQVRMDRVYDHLRACDAGVCLLYPIHNYMISAPVKSYEYMACRLPMIMSDFPMWRSAYAEVAWFVDPRDPGSIAARMREMIRDRAGCTSKGLIGRAAVEAGLCWEREAEVLIDLYRRLSQ